jgi:hypothetical protein
MCANVVLFCAQMIYVRKRVSTTYVLWYSDNVNIINEVTIVKKQWITPNYPAFTIREKQQCLAYFAHIHVMGNKRSYLATKVFTMTTLFSISLQHRQFFQFVSHAVLMRAPAVLTRNPAVFRLLWIDGSFTVN